MKLRRNQKLTLVHFRPQSTTLTDAYLSMRFNIPLTENLWAAGLEVGRGPRAVRWAAGPRAVRWTAGPRAVRWTAGREVDRGPRAVRWTAGPRAVRWTAGPRAVRWTAGRGPAFSKTRHELHAVNEGGVTKTDPQSQASPMVRHQSRDACHAISHAMHY